jgi:amino acid adenylation domain-containing protein
MLGEHDRALQSLIADQQATQRSRLAAPGHEPPLHPPLGGQRLLHDPFLDQARKAPGAPAVISGDRTLTYAQVRDLASEAAAQIAGLVPSGSLVAIIMDKGWEQVVAAVAAVMAGCAFVPIEASWPASRVASLLAKTGAPVVITQSGAASRLDLPGHVSVIMADQLTGAAQPTAPRAVSRAADDLAYVIFTSGSTGAPKGVMISHRGALNTVLDVNARFGIGPHDRMLAVSPFSFDLSVYDVFGTLAAGAAVVVPTEDERTNPSALARLARHQRVSVWNSVPVLMDLLLDSLQGQAGSWLPDLRTCMLSGDWIPLSMPDRIRAQAPGARVISLGGATEGSIWSILYEVGRVDPGWASIPYGRPMTGQTVRVLADDLTPCPPWTPGQIHIGGHGTALGYWDEPELTAAAFVADGQSGQRQYRTGDQGRLLPDGTIEFLGRKDEQVKIGGYRVETAEVEAALTQVPGVSRAAVVATGPRTGQRLAAFAAGTASSTEVRAGLATRLPAHMIPAMITITASLPVTSTGKIDRAQLRRAADAAPGQPPARPGPGHPASAELAALVASIVPGEPQPARDLLEYGLTSVDVIRLCNAVERRFGQRPDLQSFYAAPTIAYLAASLALQQAAGEVAGQPAGGAPPGPWDGTAAITDPQEREAFRARFPGYPPAPASRLLPAAPPQRMQQRARRRTLRDFSLAAIPARQLGSMLDSLRMVTIDGRGAFLYPSAGGLYSVAAYLHIRPGRVDGVAGGMYYYHPGVHDLVALAGDFDLAPEIHLGPVNRPAARAAAFTIFLCTDPGDSVPLYGRDAEQLAFLNAGYMGHLLCDSAARAGLALCPVHGIDFGAVRWLFPGGDRLVLLHALLGGLTPAPPESRQGEGTPS